MVNIVKLLRSATLGNRPTGAVLVAGAPYVNFAEKQFGVVDSTPTAQDLIGVPFFSASANYSAGQPVNHLGQLYVALTSVTASAWNPANWSAVASAASAVIKAGDTMTGNLALPTLTATGQINVSGAAGTNRALYLETGALNRWSMYVDTLAEGGSNAGSNFNIGRYTDAGAFIDVPLNIERTAGNVTVNAGLLSNSSRCITGRICQPGINAAGRVNKFNIDWTGSAQLWIDAVNAGTITVSSDYRIKRDVADLPSTWTLVKALRPVSYKHQDYTPPDTPAKADGTPADPLILADDKERWGFIAHELQETLIDDAATGEKDSPTHIQSPNEWTLLATLTKALQEAMARIEALEARP